ncbi:MAG: cold shock domain-containing protein [bacterium]|nr:cold shock domain-containing protein [bacterium]
MTNEAEDVFVHHSNIEGTGFKNFDDEPEAEFNMVKGPKGYQAEAVQKLSRW